MPRKTRGRGPSHVALDAASMRPRPDAAENDGYDSQSLRPRLASMRPRPDAAENRVGPCGDGKYYYRASMRPRPDAAENCSVFNLGAPAPGRLQ